MFRTLAHLGHSLAPRTLLLRPAFCFSEGKGKLPRNKEEAWMMQQQQRLKQSPLDQDDGTTYTGYSKYSVLAMALMVGSLIYLNNYAEKKSEENLDFFEEDITGLKELKENKNIVGGDWTLVDTEGRPFSSNNLAGYYYLIYFGFTNCPDICPSALYYLATVYRVIRNIPEGAYLRLKVVFVSVDPERDTPDKVKQFLSHFSKTMIGVTGTGPEDEELNQCLKKFRIHSKKIQREGQPDNYNIDHTTRIFLMGPQNNYLDYIDPAMSEQQAAKAVVAAIVSNEHKMQKMLEVSGH